MAVQFLSLFFLLFQEMIARPYQLDLADYVQARNGIIYLPTGAGKTFVAILALKRFSHTLQE